MLLLQIILDFSTLALIVFCANNVGVKETIFFQGEILLKDTHFSGLSNHMSAGVK